MSDHDDFTFDEEESGSEEWHEEEPVKKRKKGGGSRTRLLVLLLLLIVIAAGAYYFLLMPPADGGPAAPPRAVVSVKKQPVAMPERKPINPPVSAPAPAGQEAKTDEPVASAPAAPAPAAMPDQAAGQPTPVEAPAPAPAPVAEQPASAPSPSAAAAVPVPPAPAPVAVFEKPAEVKPAMVDGAYTLTAGTFLLDSSVRNVSKKIRALSFEPVLKPVKRKITMTRLKVGTYPLTEAAAKIAKLKSTAPDVFGIRKGDMETVYVGSYAVLDKARRYADTLYTKGVSVTEEPVEVEQTLQRITFGAFADMEAAESVRRQADAKGIDAKVVKNR